MSRNNPLRGEAPLPDLPTLVTNAHPQGSATHPEEPLAVLVELEWTDGYTEVGIGYARAWTAGEVLVQVTTSRGQYYSWVPPSVVERR